VAEFEGELQCRRCGSYAVDPIEVVPSHILEEEGEEAG
jgi:hypothetical protein